MGTRADFYVEKDGELEWLGSTAWDGHPEGFDDTSILRCSAEKTFRAIFAAKISIRKDCTLPEHGWPWPWNDSNLTDYSYALRDGKVWTSRFGSPWFDHANIPKEAMDEDGYLDGDLLPGDKPKFPDMTDIKNVTFGGRSGLIVIGRKGLEGK